MESLHQTDFAHARATRLPSSICKAEEWLWQRVKWQGEFLPNPSCSPSSFYLQSGLNNAVRCVCFTPIVQWHGTASIRSPSSAASDARLVQLHPRTLCFIQTSRIFCQHWAKLPLSSPIDFVTTTVPNLLPPNHSSSALSIPVEGQKVNNHPSSLGRGGVAASSPPTPLPRPAAFIGLCILLLGHHR